jgi:hypothetical protein
MMFRIGSESELLAAFRPLEREEVELPDHSYPLLVRNALSWTSPAGHRTYLVFSSGLGSRPLGIVFRRGGSPGSRDGRAGAPPALCEFCKCMKGGGEVSLLTATVSDKRRVGLLACSDLSCLEREDANPRQIVRRMEEFARRTLF